MSENENKYDISKHPLVVIALAVVGTFGFSYQFVLPIMTAKLQNDVDKIPRYEKQIKVDKVRIEELEKKLSEVKTQIQLYETANLFIHDSPYPAGFRKVRIGDSIENLITTYEKQFLEKKDGYWEVKTQNSVFNEAIYYFNEKSSKKEITHILFRSEFALDNRMFLQSKLEDAFGQPVKYKRQGFYSWKFAEATLYKNDNFSFLLMDNNHYPFYFPQE